MRRITLLNHHYTYFVVDEDNDEILHFEGSDRESATVQQLKSLYQVSLTPVNSEQFKVIEGILNLDIKYSNELLRAVFRRIESEHHNDQLKNLNDLRTEIVERYKRLFKTFDFINSELFNISCVDYDNSNEEELTIKLEHDEISDIVLSDSIDKLEIRFNQAGEYESNNHNRVLAKIVEEPESATYSFFITNIDKVKPTLHLMLLELNKLKSSK